MREHRTTGAGSGMARDASGSWQKVLGAFLVAIGLAGFLTVADDIRHAGEILGIGSILAAGVVLLDVGPGRLMFTRHAAQWISFGLLAGAGFGAGIDNMPAGIGLGAALGSLVGFVMGRKEP